MAFHVGHRECRWGGERSETFFNDFFLVVVVVSFVPNEMRGGKKEWDDVKPSNVRCRLDEWTAKLSSSKNKNRKKKNKSEGNRFGLYTARCAAVVKRSTRQYV